jgi:peptide/nickel transport system substrate-binding protein
LSRFDRTRTHASPRRRAHGIPLGLVLALTLAACSSGGGTGGGGSDASGSGGILRIAMSAGNLPQPVTPPTEGAEGSRFVGNTIYDGLTRFNTEQGDAIPKPVPGLAESWEVSADKLTWTFKLRSGIKFHDGSPFNADAVVFQFDRMKKPGSPYYDTLNAPRHAEQYRYFKSWQKVDDLTVSITTPTPYAWIDWDLARILLPSPAMVQQYGNDGYAAHASGTGPFKMTKYVDGEVMELKANPDYYRGKPKLDGIVLYPQPEAASRTASLQSGEVDWAEVPSPDALKGLKAQGFQVFLKEYPHCICPGFNMFRGPFTDIRLRQALNYAADREGLAKIISDTGVGASQYVTKNNPAFAQGVGYGYDPAKAKQLIAEAGYKPGELKVKFAYTINGSGNMYPGPMVEKIQQDFKAVGVEMELIPYEWGAFTTVGQIGLQDPKYADYDILWRSPTAGLVPTSLGQGFLCERGNGQKQVTGYCNPKADALYNQALQTFEQPEYEKLLTQMERTITEDAPALFWMHDLNLRVLSNKVHGYVHPQSWFVDYMSIWVSTDR